MKDLEKREPLRGGDYISPRFALESALMTLSIAADRGDGVMLGAEQVTALRAYLVRFQQHSPEGA